MTVLQVHGEADEIIAYAGGQRHAAYPSARASVEAWRERNGCSLAQRAQSGARYDLFTTPTLTETWNCKRSRVALWTVREGRHLLQHRPRFVGAALAFLARE